MKKTSNTLKAAGSVFNVNDYLSTGIDKSEVLELKDAFDLLDEKGSGKILVSSILVIIIRSHRSFRNVWC